jgi:hypothetical protein
MSKKDRIMPHLKFSISTVEEYQARQMALKRGISLAEVARRALQEYIASAAAHVQAPAAVADRLERNDQGKVTAAYLSPPLAKAVRRLASETKASTSHVIRDLQRCELRRRGLLPSKQWGMADAVGAGADHVDAVADNAAP